MELLSETKRAASDRRASRERSNPLYERAACTAGDDRSIHSINLTPPREQPKPIVLTAKLDIDSRTLAQSMSQAIAELLENSMNAPSMNGASLFNNNGANPEV